MNERSLETDLSLGAPARLLSWIATPVFLFCFGLILIVVHPLLVLGGKLGYRYFKPGQDLLSFLLTKNLALAGVKVRVNLPAELPTGRPVILVVNHQSMFDIPVLKWHLRQLHPRFVSKVELGRGIPSISAVLRYGGAALINRKDPKQAIPEIRKLGTSIIEKCHAACIFPEGTRARDGVMKQFKPAGLSTLVKAAPSAVLLPVAIRGSWEIFKFKLRPIPWGITFQVDVLPFIEPGTIAKEALAGELEARIRAVVESVPPVRMRE